MNALTRKLLRDLWDMKTQALAIALVVACGVATFVMSISVLHTLDQTRAHYYERFRFGQVFAHFTRAPRAIVDRVAEIPGVASAEGRVVTEANLDLPGMIEPAVGRLVSIPDYEEPALNALYLRRGRWPEPGRRGEVLANEAFAAAHGFEPGDAIYAVINGHRERLTMVGIALSPEYVYQIRGGDLFPDDLRFGVLWMREQPLAAALDLSHACNEVSVALRRGAIEAEVIQRLDALLSPYGGQGAYGRSEQVSNRYVSDELTQLRAMATVPPAIFLLVAVFVLNVLINRTIATQREQIATLKAFGYTPLEIGWHYLQLALLIITTGVALGVGVGVWLGHDLARLYTRFFRFPELEYQFDTAVVGQAVLLSLAAGALAVAAAIARVVRLPPAVAMQAEPPGRFRRAWLERLGLGRWLGQTGRMVARQLERRPVRAALSVTGIALGTAVMVLGSFGEDMIDYIIDFQFGAMQHYDFSVALVEPSSPAALPELGRLPGVLRAEPFRSVAVRLGHGPRSRRVGIVGLPAERQLLHLLDADSRPVALPSSGLLISEKLAQLLGVARGDVVTAEVLEGSRPVRELVVADTLRDYSGLAAYMALPDLNRFLREGDVISGAFLLVDPGSVEAVYRAVKATPRVAAVRSQAASLRSFQQTFSENLLRMRLFNVVFASIMAFGVVYNAARITLAERAREMATLRVIGLTRVEVSAILLGEIAALTLIAIPLGLVLGRWLSALAVWGLETETQRFPLVIAPATYGMAAATILIAAMISCFVVRRRVDALDLIAVLKSHD